MTSTRISEIVPTVKVVSERSPHGYIVINKSDMRDDHRLFERQAPVISRAVTMPPLTSVGIDQKVRIVRGARGKFYVKRGAQIASKGFDTEGAARAWLEAEGSFGQTAAAVNGTDS